MGKVALLWLTMREPLHANLWKELLTPHLDKFSIYIHPKYPSEVSDEFYKKFVIPENVPTKWENTARAFTTLIRGAYKDPDNYKFIYLSDSCFPLYPLPIIYDKLIAGEDSYMSHCAPWWDTDGRWPPGLPKEYRWVAAAWMILNRLHVRLIVEDTVYSSLIYGYHCDNESYPAILFRALNILGQFKGKPTHDDWSRTDGSHPFTYSKIEDLSEEYWQAKRAEGFYFIRKIGKEMPDEHLRNLLRS